MTRLFALTHSLAEIDGVGRYSVSILKQAKRFCDSIGVFLSRKHRGISQDFPKNIGVKEVLPPDYMMYMSLPRFYLFMALTLPRVVMAARKADIIHCLCDYPFSVMAQFAGGILKKPVIISGHGTYSVAPFRYPVHKRLITKSYSRADAVLFGSDFAKGKFDAHLKLPNVSVLDYGVDVSAFAGIAPPLPDKIKPPYILCVGEVKERKGYEISIPAFIGAAKKAENLLFVVVGNYNRDDPYFKKQVLLLEREGLLDRVLFLGNVTEEEKHSLYSHCEAFILCPKESAEGGFEALGLVYLEAGACQVPVIGVYNSGAVCAIKHNENGFLFHPDHPEEGSEALLKVLNDPQLKQRMGEKGKRMAMDRNWDRVGEKLERIYAELINKEK